MQKKMLLACASMLLLLQPLAATADSKQDCIVSGRVFQDAMRSEVLSIAYGEQIDWRRIDYYTLPKSAQERIEVDISKMRPTAESIVANVQKDVSEWNRQGMDGNSMAREILLGGMENLAEKYAIQCLKAQ
ncbi:hypothetical protein C3Y98_00975 [Methylotenera oryzisoli]|uniref:Uncharacterized protein n=1 Tax=Methylotenera oryzisoli TaxID=2080758 RepID=A0A4Y9VUH2_9PROT|nr:hypothetical protein [Methylotenera oryzisoli]TFW72964.1 hypothetical protein C3Y98_00975 [Methylotenera oryzisoli]